MEFGIDCEEKPGHHNEDALGSEILVMKMMHGDEETLKGAIYEKVHQEWELCAELEAAWAGDANAPAQPCALAEETQPFWGPSKASTLGGSCFVTSPVASQ